jgi:hypothetical protein
MIRQGSEIEGAPELGGPLRHTHHVRRQVDRLALGEVVRPAWAFEDAAGHGVEREGRVCVRFAKEWLSERLEARAVRARLRAGPRRRAGLGEHAGRPDRREQNQRDNNGRGTARCAHGYLKLSLHR